MNQAELKIEINKHLASDSKWTRNAGHYHGPAPSVIRANSDSDMFHIDYLNNRYFDHKTKIGGGLRNLGHLLGIQGIDTYTPIKTEIAANLAEYERLRGLPKDYLKMKGWKDGVGYGRKCIFIPTVGMQADGNPLFQLRFLDDQKPKYLPSAKVARDKNDSAINPIYGLSAAIKMAHENKIPYLVQTNGAISAEVAQYHGIPAFAVIGGEGNCDKRHVDTVLNNTDLQIVIILDCDTSGVSSAKSIAKMYGERSTIIDLPGEYGTGFDLGDFCMLFAKSNPAQEIERMAKVAKTKKPARTIEQAGAAVIAQLQGKVAYEGRDIPFPFDRMHQFEGGAFVMQPRLLSGVVGVSGGGKTSFWQTITQLLLRQTRKWGILVDAREFTSKDDYTRHLIRDTNVGLSSNDIARHRLYQQMKAESGIIEDSEQALGRVLSEAKMSAVIQHQANQKFYSGYLEYADEFDYIEETVEYMFRRTMELRAKGRKIDLWIFDYLTLYRATQATMQGVGENIYNAILSIIKKWTRQANVHSLIMLQPNKEPSQDAKGKNKLLTEYDIGYVNPNHFNFLMSINILYGTKSEWTKSDNKSGYTIVRSPTDGQTIKDKALLRNGAFAAIWKGLKNTNGRENWSLRVTADMKRMHWKQDEWIASDLCLPLNAGD